MISPSCRFPLNQVMFFACAALAFAVPSSQAATILINEAAPSENLLLSNNNPHSGGSGNQIQYTTTNHRRAGFTFTSPGSATLNEVSLLINNTGTPPASIGATLHVDIFRVNALNEQPSYIDDSPILSETGTININYTTLNANMWLSIALDNPLILESGQSYAVVVYFANDAYNAGFQLRYSTTPVAGSGIGQSFYQQVGSEGWTVNGSNPYVFTLVSIPEPETAALLSGALLLVGGLAKVQIRKK